MEVTGDIHVSFGETLVQAVAFKVREFKCVLRIS